MGFYIVVHHRKDTHQLWNNVWLDDDRLMTITTDRYIGEYCLNAIGYDQPIFVHRCMWADQSPTICCAVQVASADPIDKKNYLVSFKSHKVLDILPLINPLPGTRYYEA